MQALQKPPLNEGETYIASLTDKTGEMYHLILLPGDNDDAPQAAQIEWAKSIGGDLPNKIEAAILFGYAKDQFKTEWYWTNETFIDPDEPEDTSYAWIQDFDYGSQGFSHKDNEFRARAVRRLVI